MKMYEIATDVDLDFGEAAGDAIDMNDEDHPFVPGNTVIGVVSVVGFAQDGEGALAIEGREETTDSWEAKVTGGPGAAPLKMGSFVLTRYLRYDIASVTAGDGRGSAYLLAT